MECSGSQGGPSARRSCRGHARYLAKDVLEGASGRKKKTLFFCEPPGTKKASTPASFNVHLEQSLARCPYFLLLCFALHCPCSYRPMSSHSTIISWTQPNPTARDLSRLNSALHVWSSPDISCLSAARSAHVHSLYASSTSVHCSRRTVPAWLWGEIRQI